MKFLEVSFQYTAGEHYSLTSPIMAACYGLQFLSKYAVCKVDKWQQKSSRRCLEFETMWSFIIGCVCSGSYVSQVSQPCLLPGLSMHMSTQTEEGPTHG